MTAPVPDACVEAVLKYVGCTRDFAETVARAVLHAADTAETVGAWWVTPLYMRANPLWYVQRDGYATVGPFDTESEAIGVRNFLNRTRLAAGEVGT